MVARRAHNPEGGGSSPSLATQSHCLKLIQRCFGYLCISLLNKNFEIGPCFYRDFFIFVRPTKSNQHDKSISATGT